MPRPLLFDYDPAWPEEFERVAVQVVEALGSTATEVHHVGSTSVPGCAAKDVIDVLVLAAPDATDDDLIGALEALGYEHRGDLALYLPERWYLSRRRPRSVHLHVERSGLAGQGRDPRVVLRDALRADDELRDRYVSLKTRLATEHADDIEAYTDAKGDFINEVLAEAAERGDHIGVHIRREDPSTWVATQLVDNYIAHLSVTVPNGFDCATDSPPPPGAFEAPRGTFLVAYDDLTPIGCGAVWEMEPGVAEIRRMWVEPEHHGRGIGRRMLVALERAASSGLGCSMARLDSMRALSAAVAMYRSHGYVEIASYNANPNADIWFERRLP